MAWYNDIQPTSSNWSAITAATGAGIEGSLAPLFRNVHPMLGGLAPSGGPYRTEPVKYGLPMDSQMLLARSGLGRVATGTFGQAFSPDAVANLDVSTPGEAPEQTQLTLEDVGRSRNGTQVYRLNIPYLTPGAPVNVQTGESETVVVRLANRATVTVRELSNTTFQADQIPPGQLTLALRFLNSLMPYTPPIVDTPNAVVGVRGVVQVTYPGEAWPF